MSDDNFSESRFFALKAGDSNVVIEAFDNTPQSGPVSRRGVVEDTGKTLENALAQLNEILGPLRSQVKAQLADAEEIVIEFGLKITAEANLVVAKSELEGNFKIAVKWKK